MEIEATEVRKVNAKILKMFLKVSDRFCSQLLSDTGKVLVDQEEGYVPDFMPGSHFGDYVYLDIDIDTGQIVNWEKPTVAKLEQWIEDWSEEV